MAEMIDMGYEGFEEREGEYRAYIPEEDFEEEPLRELAARNGFEFELNKIENRNWNELWESGYEPVRLGTFAAVRAHFHTPIPDVKYELVITPKMSFGTGHHATTLMMMEWMQDLDLAGKSVLDMGTGTGVLAILAEKMGAERIVAIDFDDWSIENAKENGAVNECSRLELIQSDKIATPLHFDLVLANINLHVILPLLPDFKNHLNPSGLLVLSGFLPDDEVTIREAADAIGLKFIALRYKNNWLSMTFKG